MKWIEFLGPSGVGKSTLFKQVLASRTQLDAWITSDEAMQLVATTHPEYMNNVSIFDQAKAMLRRLLGFQYVGDQARLNKRKLRQDAINKLAGRYDLIALLLLRDACEITGRGAFNKLRFISWYVSERMQDFIALDYAFGEQMILFEDGILHNNAGLAKLDLYAPHLRQHDVSDLILCPEGIIYCTNAPEVILERIRAREAGGKGRFTHHGLGDEELMQHVDQSVWRNGRKVDILSKRGVPILTVHTSEDLRASAYRVNAFIRQLCG